ncbi:MAG: hypothetical protein V1858_00200 [Candidatus Gottesmanbacteria bacterium]
MNSIISTTILRNNLADVLEEITDKRDYLLVTKKSDPISAIVNLDFFEDLLALANSKYLKNIKEARQQYQKGQVYTFDEAFGKL